MRRAARFAAHAWLAAVCVAAALQAVQSYVRQDGYQRVYAWGDNRFGELGIGSYESQASRPLASPNEPALVESLSWKKLTNDKVANIFAGHDHSAAVTRGGRLYTWGRNDDGQLGLGVYGGNFMSPTLVTVLAEFDVVDACCGLMHTLAVSSKGRTYASGSNQYGQLGRDYLPDQFPRVAEFEEVDVNGEFVTAVACGTAHSVALTQTGAVYTWGANQEGQLGLGGCRKPGGPANDPCLQPRLRPARVTRTSVPLSSLPAVKLIAAGGNVAGGTNRSIEGGHTVVVTKSNTIYSWGDNFFGQLGVPQEYKRLSPTSETYTPNTYDNVTGRFFNRRELPTYVGGLDDRMMPPPPPPSPPMPPAPPSNATASTGGGGGGAVMAREWPEIVNITCGSHHSAAMTADGEIYMWGDNAYGQLGLGYFSDRREPNWFYRTAQGTADGGHFPEMVDVPTRVRKYDYYVKRTKQVKQGNDTITVEYFETIRGRVRDEGGAKFVSVAAGKFQTMARTGTGTVYVWGNNMNHELGTDGCGACGTDAGKYGSCPVRNAPPPPSPLAPGEEEKPMTAAQVMAYQEELLESRIFCECNCPGDTTCTFAESTATSAVRNRGVCVGFGNETRCECMPPYLEMEGVIRRMSEPMMIRMTWEFNFTAVALAVGGGLFAVTQAPCPDNDRGDWCSGAGTCVGEGTGATCICDEGSVGFFCEFPCPRATQEDQDALIQFHAKGYDDKFPGGKYDPELDGVIVGEICGGHGSCQQDGSCLCDGAEGHDMVYFGERCHLMCPRDNARKFCSDNGTCTWDPSIEAQPYCMCEHYDSKAEGYAGECLTRGLLVQPNGWCSFHDHVLGFDACYTDGQCGICADPAPLAGPSMLALALLPALVAAVRDAMV